MLKFRYTLWNPTRCIYALLFFAILMASSTPALAQADFGLSASALNPPAVDPGVSSTGTITISSLNGFSDPVALSCAVTPAQQTSPPVCVVNPTTVTPPASPSVTVTTSGSTSPGTYTLTITGTDTLNSALTHTTAPILTVLSVTPDYTLTVSTSLTPTSLHAGSTAQAVISVIPVNGYSGDVTLACTEISPPVTIPPLCSFNPPVVPVAGVTQTSTLTITTFAPVTTSLVRPRIFYALWLPLPGIALLGAGLFAGGRRRRKLFGLAALFTIAFGLLLVPACGGSTSTPTSNSTNTTPNNTYTFTLSGADAFGVVQTNTDPSLTVSLTVN